MTTMDARTYNAKLDEIEAAVTALKNVTVTDANEAQLLLAKVSWGLVSMDARNCRSAFRDAMERFYAQGTEEPVAVPRTT